MATYRIAAANAGELHSFLEKEFLALNDALKHRHESLQKLQNEKYNFRQRFLSAIVDEDPDIKVRWAIQGIDELEALQDQMIRVIRVLACPYFEKDIILDDCFLTQLISGTKFY